MFDWLRYDVRQALRGLLRERAFANAHLEFLTARDKGIVLDSLERHLAQEPLAETRNRK